MYDPTPQDDKVPLEFNGRRRRHEADVGDWLKEEFMRVEQLTRFASDFGSLARTSSIATATEFLVRTALHSAEVLRSGRLSIVDADMGRANYSWRVCGTRVEVPGRFFGGAREMYARQVYFARPGFDPRPDDVVLDLGANAGLFTVLAALRAERVIAVEAQAGFRTEAMQLLEQNNCADKVVFECALIGTGTGVFADPEKLQQSSHFQHTPPVVTIPDLLARHSVDQVGLLKCDIEGSEFDIFRPDSSWLRKVDRVVAEVHTQFGDHQQLADVFRGFDFAVTSLDSRLRPLTLPTREPSTYLFAQRGGTRATLT